MKPQLTYYESKTNDKSANTGVMQRTVLHQSILFCCTIPHRAITVPCYILHHTPALKHELGHEQGETGKKNKKLSVGIQNSPLHACTRRLSQTGKWTTLRTINPHTTHMHAIPAIPFQKQGTSNNSRGNRQREVGKGSVALTFDRRLARQVAWGIAESC